jgi:hypothetical protein
LTYKPQPGSVPERAIEHLQRVAPAGGRDWILSATLSNAVRCPNQALRATMEAALKHGLVVREKGADGGFRWQAGSDANAPRAFNFRAGSAGDKAYRALQLRKSMTDLQMAMETDLELDDLQGMLAFAIREGAIKRDPKGDDDGLWTLGDGKPVTPSPAPTVAPAPAKPAAADGIDMDAAHRAAPVHEPAPASPVVKAGTEPKGVAGAARRPETAKETTQRGAVAGAGEDAKRDGSPAIPGGLRIALWSDGELHIRRPGGDDIVLSKLEMRQVVKYLDAISLDGVREAA